MLGALLILLLVLVFQVTPVYASSPTSTGLECVIIPSLPPRPGDNATIRDYFYWLRDVAFTAITALPMGLACMFYNLGSLALNTVSLAFNLIPVIVYSSLVAPILVFLNFIRLLLKNPIEAFEFIGKVVGWAIALLHVLWSLILALVRIIIAVLDLLIPL